MKPPFPYFGGKAGMAQRIVSMFPPHRIYMEPFFGSGAVLFAKPRSRFEIVNDVDGALVTFWRVLRERPEQLAWVCAMTPHSRDEFAAADMDQPGLDDLEVARRFWVRVNQSFAKTAGRRTGWSITTARTQGVPASMLAKLHRFAPAAERLAGVSIENCDAADLVTRLATPDTVVYADPPYLAETRSNCSHSNASDYRHDMGSVAAHERLLEVLLATPATVVLSGYPSPLYDEMLADWHRQEHAVTVHSSNATTNERSARTEVIWTNRRPTVEQLPLEAS